MKSNKDGGRWLVMNGVPIETILDKDRLITVSLDPGVVNPAISIEKWKKNRTRYKARTIVLERHEIVGRTKNGRNDTYHNLTNWLMTYIKYIKQADLVLIEAQMHPRSHMPLRVMAHMICFFSLMSPEASVVQVSTTVKYRYLGCSYAQLKPCSEVRGMELLEARGDRKGIGMLQGIRTHDMTDCIIYTQAVLELLGWIPSD